MVTFKNISKNVVKYLGEFNNGKAHDQGTYTWPNGQKFVGEFKDGKYWTVIVYERYGTILGRISKGQLVEGEWE